MTTGPVMSITDDQIAEIEYLASNATRGDWEFHICEIRANYDSDGYTVIAESPSVPKNWRDQRDTNMRYMATVCPAVAQALIARLREAERDAARYRWIREVASGAPEDFEVVADAAFVAAYGCDHNFDLNIDAAMMSAHEAAE